MTDEEITRDTEPEVTPHNMTDPGWSNNPPGPPLREPTEGENPFPPPGWSNVDESGRREG